MGRRRILTAEGPRQGISTSRIVLPREIRAGRHRLFYAEAGLGAPLLLVHGLGGSCRWWFSLLPELTSNGFRTVAPDLPGFGRSPGRALSIDGAARAVIDLADHLELGRFFLAGHSMGGAIAARIAADHGARIRRLVLVDSAGIPARATLRALGRLLQPWSWCPVAFYPTLIGDVLRAGPRSLLTGAREVRRRDLRPTLRRINTPTLIVWGEKDTLTPPEHAREFAARIPRARLESVPDARHLPMVSHPGKVAGLVVRFLNEALGEEERSGIEHPER